MKIRRKTNACLNCGHTLSEVYNFCPHCGQENNDHRVSLGTFVGDFFSNYFSFDSRIGRSLKPFFLRPGFLTNQFNEGKRMRYVHPLRLYLIVSLGFFFLVSLNVDQELSGNDREFGSGFVVGILGLDSLSGDSTELIRNVILSPTLSNEEMSDSLRQLGQERVVERIDSLQSNWFVRRFFDQGRRLASLGPAFFVTTLVKNLPFVLLIAMPLFALLLKAVYIRRKKLYVQHLVHTLHLHSLSLMVFSLVIALYLVGVSDKIDDYSGAVVVLVLLSYFLLSFRNVYQQGWAKTISKMLLISIVYAGVLGSTIVLEVLASFLIF